MIVYVQENNRNNIVYRRSNFNSGNFGDNKVAQTILNHADVTIHRKTKENVDLYVRRSFSDHLWAWIKDSVRFI